MLKNLLFAVLSPLVWILALSAPAFGQTSCAEPEETKAALQQEEAAISKQIEIVSAAKISKIKAVKADFGKRRQKLTEQIHRARNNSRLLRQLNAELAALNSLEKSSLAQINSQFDKRLAKLKQSLSTSQTALAEAQTKLDSCYAVLYQLRNYQITSDGTRFNLTLDGGNPQVGYIATVSFSAVNGLWQLPCSRFKSITGESIEWKSLAPYNCIARYIVPGNSTTDISPIFDGPVSAITFDSNLAVLPLKESPRVFAQAAAAPAVAAKSVAFAAAPSAAADIPQSGDLVELSGENFPVDGSAVILLSRELERYFIYPEASSTANLLVFKVPMVTSGEFSLQVTGSDTSWSDPIAFETEGYDEDEFTPQLSIRLAGSNVVVSWDPPNPEAKLMGTSNFVTWEYVPTPPGASYGTFPIGAYPYYFYKLMVLPPL